MTPQSWGVLGCVRYFHLLTPLKALFCSLVRPLLEYGTILWDPSTTSASRSMIERVQRKFLCHAAFKLNVPCPPHDYKPIQRLFSIESLSLADRRHSVVVNQGGEGLGAATGVADSVFPNYGLSDKNHASYGRNTD
ncbi:Uncharacterized protein FWK35_00012275 [Aphis craccivora]|uniref:Reverse transcriptase domain-containing protein n=1 Tax=Aphis craccivora TaxID=307492 RepID=A0A6G0YYZ4_APHCR|nr:Uncharacterized protein FWK35_00012275 [Aphis craccivora]